MYKLGATSSIGPGDEVNMTKLFKDLMTGLHEVDAFLAAERAGHPPAPHFHTFHISPGISTQNISPDPLRRAPAGVRSKSTEE
jgi:hypothetical protein